VRSVDVSRFDFEALTDPLQLPMRDPAMSFATDVTPSS